MVKSYTLALTVIFFLFSARVFAAADTTQKNDTSRVAQGELSVKTTIGYPVVPFKDTLFYIYTRIGSFTAADRAASVTERIRNILFRPAPEHPG